MCFTPQDVIRKTADEEYTFKATAPFAGANEINGT